MPNCLLKSFYVSQQGIRVTTTWYHLDFKVCQLVVVKCCLIKFLFVYFWFNEGEHIFMFIGDLHLFFFRKPVHFVFKYLFCIFMHCFLGCLFVVIVDFFNIPYIFCILIFICFEDIWCLKHCMLLSSSQERLYFLK